MTPALFPPARLRIAAQILGAVVANEGPNCCPKQAAARALAHADALIQAAGYDDNASAALFDQAAAVLGSVVAEHAAARTAASESHAPESDKEPPVVPMMTPPGKTKPGKTKPNRT